MLNGNLDTFEVQHGLQRLSLQLQNARYTNSTKNTKTVNIFFGLTCQVSSLVDLSQGVRFLEAELLIQVVACSLLPKHICDWKCCYFFEDISFKNLYTALNGLTN